MPGFTCCVPGCYSNSHRDRDLRFYTFPKDTVQREIWLKNISRAGVSGCFSTFQPTTGHRVCSIHFAGGRKTYSVRVPTLFPLRGVNERKNRRGRKGKVSATLPVITSVVSLSANAGAELSAASPEVGVDVLPSAGKVVKNGQNGQAADPAEVTVQGDGPCLAATARDLQHNAGAASSAAGPPSARYTVVDLCTLGALDHPYSLNTGTTAAELLKKLNEQRDIIALLEIKMKEMKSTIRQLKVTEAKLKEEVRERDLMLSGAAVRKKV
ncbi:THAP domain-containing protein 11-like [Paramormyrops kingsleyae]|uniref:THAP domain-containing protein 11 n=1 Tax=Paramormyrops kingsleyae TaxID=1676925 RepID=A0A3B3R5D1_9TELE|nr:THAP domain-containing protein 11-like [Paramormyrops kingsleyae]